MLGEQVEERGRGDRDPNANLPAIVAAVAGMKPEDVYVLTGVSDPRLRPGGEEVAYVVWTIDKDENEYRQSIWLARTDGSEAPRRFTTGTNDAGAALVPGRHEACVRFEARRRRESAPSALRAAGRRRRAGVPD